MDLGAIGVQVEIFDVSSKVDGIGNDKKIKDENGKRVLERY